MDGGGGLERRRWRILRWRWRVVAMHIQGLWGRSPVTGHTELVADCSICGDNAASEEGIDPWFVARLQTGYVRLSPNQYFKGSLFFSAKLCVREVFDLEIHVRELHVAEMTEVAAAANDVFTPRKMNIESLGNGVPHLHWWITPRYDTDPRPIAPIWEDLDFLRTQWCDGGRPTAEESSASREALVDALRTRDVTVELAS